MSDPVKMNHVLKLANRKWRAARLGVLTARQERLRISLLTPLHTQSLPCNQAFPHRLHTHSPK